MRDANASQGGQTGGGDPEVSRGRSSAERSFLGTFAFCAALDFLLEKGIINSAQAREISQKLSGGDLK